MLYFLGLSKALLLIASLRQFLASQGSRSSGISSHTRSEVLRWLLVSIENLLLNAVYFLNCSKTIFQNVLALVS